MEINRVFIFITMAVVLFAMSSALPSSAEQKRESTLGKDCTTDNKCDSNQKCEDGKCVNPCDSHPCGDNQICRRINHEAQCECLFEYTGNPLTGCTLMDQEKIHEKILELHGPKALESYMAFRKGDPNLGRRDI